MAKFERKCIVCGKTYIFCPHKSDGAPTWHLIYCGDNCHDMWELITTIYDQKGAIVAAEGLDELDYSYLDEIREDVKEKIERIYAEAGKTPPYKSDEDSFEYEEETYEFDDEDDSDSMSSSVDE